MQSGQPIWWDEAGTKLFGVVAEVLPAKGGVMVYTEKTGKGKKLVKQPHKITDADTLEDALIHFKDIPEVQEWVEKHRYKPEQPVAPTKTEQDFVDCFGKALGAIGSPSTHDALILHALGVAVDGVELPKTDVTTTPTDKLFF